MVDNADDDDKRLDRRTVLSLGTSAAMTLAGLGTISSPAAAYERLDPDFRGCSEVWIVVDEHDLDCEDADGNNFETADKYSDNPNNECPLQVVVLLASGSDVTCQRVDITRERARTIPGQYGDAPLIKFEAPGDAKILGIAGLTPSRNVVATTTYENEHRCTETPNTPSFDEALCACFGDDAPVDSCPGESTAAQSMERDQESSEDEESGGPPSGERGPPDGERGPPDGERGPPHQVTLHQPIAGDRLW